MLHSQFCVCIYRLKICCRWRSMDCSCLYARWSSSAKITRHRFAAESQLAVQLRWFRPKPTAASEQAAIQPRTDVNKLPTHPAYYCRLGMGFCIKELVYKQSTHPVILAENNWATMSEITNILLYEPSLNWFARLSQN